MPEPVLNPKQKSQLDSNIRAMLSNGATQDDITKYASDFKIKITKEKPIPAPDGDPVTQQKINNITQYLQNRNQRPAQDNLVPVQQVKTSLGATVSNNKKANEQNVITQLKDQKKKISDKTTTKEVLQAKYGSGWESKASKQEMADYGQGLQEFYNKEKDKGTPMVDMQPEEDVIQKATNELYKTPLGKLFYNVIQPMSYSGGKGISNTVSTITRYGGRALGIDEITEGVADWVNENINPDNRWQGTVAGTKPEKLQGGLFNDGKINLAKIVPSTIETLTTMAWITGGGSGYGSLVGRSFAMQEQDYRNEGAKYGLKGDALDNFAVTSAGLTSVLEMLSPNRLITGSVKKAFTKQYAKAISEGFTSKIATKIALKEFKNQVVAENIQEISQLVGDKVVRLITDKISDKPVFNDDISFSGIQDELAETVLLTTLSTGLLSSPNTLRNRKPTNLEKSAWFNVSENPEQYKEFINKQIVDGILTPEQAANAGNFFSKYQTAVNQAKEFGFSQSQQAEVAWQIFKGNDIEETVKKFQTNPILKQTIAPQIKKEQDEVTTNIKRVGLGVPEVGSEITGQDLAQIIGNIGDKGGAGESLQKRVEENTYRVDEINLQELYDKKQSFRDYVDNYDRKGDEEDGLIVPAVMDIDGKIVDGRSRLAQQFKDGKKTAQVFKELKNELPEDYNIFPPKEQTPPALPKIKEQSDVFHEYNNPDIKVQDGEFKGKGEFKRGVKELEDNTGENVVRAVANISDLSTTENIYGLSGEKDLSKYEEEIKNGIQTPIIVEFNGDNFDVMDGHHRLEAYKKLGYKEAPIVVNESGDFYLSAKKLGIDVSKLNEMTVKEIEKIKFDINKSESLLSKEQTKEGGTKDAELKVGDGKETKQQIENFGVNKEDVEPVNNLLEQVFGGLKKAGLTAAKNVGEWVGIGKGAKKPYSLKIDGKDVQVKNVSPEVVNGFYSPLEKIINESKSDKLPAKKWIEKYANSEEAKWTGLKDWLAQQQGSVSKADIQQYLKDNRIEVVEVVKGGEGEVFDYDNAPTEVKDIIDRSAEGGGDLDSQGIRDELDKIGYDISFGMSGEAESITKKGTDPTKFSTYQTEGEKSNYKEILVTMPDKKQSTYNQWFNKWDGLLKELYEKYNVSRVNPAKDLNEKMSQADKQRFDILKSQEPSKEKTDFRSSHFDEPNILVHLRTNLRTDAQGKKVLFIEEVQSDWGQKGKKEGFAIQKEKPPTYTEEQITKANEEYAKLISTPLDERGGNFNNKLNELEKVIYSKERQRNYEQNPITGQPVAPFVTDTNAWTKLGLKVALKESVKQSEVLQRNAWEKMMNEKEEWIEARMKKLGKLRIECP